MFDKQKNGTYAPPNVYNDSPIGRPATTEQNPVDSFITYKKPFRESDEQKS